MTIPFNILIVKNNFKDRYNFKTGLDWFKKHTPLDIKIDEIDTSFALSFEKLGNHTYSGFGVDDNIKTELIKVIPRYKYDVVCLIYGDKTPGIRVSCADINPLYPETEFIEVVTLKDRGKTFNHELIHSFFSKLKRRGILIDDPMDAVFINGRWEYYYMDKSLNSKQSNRTVALERLAPYWKHLAMPPVAPKLPQNERSVVTLTRTKESKKQTLGMLTATRGGATFSCQTLELPWLDNRSNISCIPKGEYEVKWTFSPKYMRNMYEVTKVPNRSGIRFHSGNYFSDIQGCILLGSGLSDINKDGELDVINSRNTIKAFEGFMGSKPFTLVIK